MTMTKAERHDLLQLIKKRERVMKSQAEERSAALIADFDAQLAKTFDASGSDLFVGVNYRLGSRLRGRFPRFVIVVTRIERGHNAVASRRAELRRAAKSRIEAIQREAITRIERMSLDAQTQVISRGLESDAAKTFLNAMPTMDALMPPVPVGEIQALIEVRHNERRRQLGYLN